MKYLVYRPNDVICLVVRNTIALYCVAKGSINLLTTIPMSDDIEALIAILSVSSDYSKQQLVEEIVDLYITNLIQTIS